MALKFSAHFSLVVISDVDCKIVPRYFKMQAINPLYLTILFLFSEIVIPTSSSLFQKKIFWSLNPMKYYTDKPLTYTTQSPQHLLTYINNFRFLVREKVKKGIKKKYFNSSFFLFSLDLRPSTKFQTPLQKNIIIDHLPHLFVYKEIRTQRPKVRLK